MRACKVLFCFFALTLGVSTSQGDLTETGPFVGDVSENFSSFAGGGGGHQSLDIFDGNVTITNLTQGGAIKIEFQSTLIFNNRSDTVVPRSPPVFMGQLGILRWDFHQGVSQFGGYFENNSFEDHVDFEFFDRHGNLIEAVVGTTFWSSDTWTWNGWHSTVPIYSAISTGRNSTLLNGFIWYDDMEIVFAPIPEPTTMAACTLLVFGLVMGGRKRGQTVARSYRCDE